MAEGITNTATIDLGEDLNCAVSGMLSILSCRHWEMGTNRHQICMQILFQPLTLLDCMHTFCGACLKDWFAHQAASARSIHPYTCPSCRDSVRSTKRYPFIMNMLEKHLAKNPDKVRSEEDKQEHVEKYKPGENVLPKLRLRGPPPDPEDERVLNEVMQLSLQEAGVTPDTLSPPETRRRGNSRGSRSRTSSRSPRRTAADSAPAAERRAAAQGPLIPQSQTDARQVQHQSSLISLLSVSEMDPQDMQEEITRMIAEEGLLDDVDLTTIDSTREEELSERIAAAYRRRKEEARRRRQREAEQSQDRSRQRDRSNQRTSSRPSSRSGAEDGSARSGDRRRTADARPPISNPQLINSANQGQTRHRRTGSSSSTRPNVRTDSGIATSSPTLGPVLVPSMAQVEDRRRRSSERSATDPSRISNSARQLQTTNTGSAPSTPRTLEPSLLPPRTHARQRSDSNPHRSPRLGSSSTFPRTSANHSTSSLPLTSTVATVEPQNSQRPGTSASIVQAGGPTPAQDRPRVYQEPSIACSNCRKGHIEYDLHYDCPQCSHNTRSYNLCQSCYRKGEGYRHYLDSGVIAWKGSEPQSKDTPRNGQQKRHILSAQRLLRPKRPLVPSPTPDHQHQQLTEEDPVQRWEKGVFCDLCASFANNCYWKCDACNDGDWGYCNSCVMQGKHCTHPLQALKAIDEEHDHAATTSQTDGHLAAPSRPEAEHQPSPPSTPKSASIIDGPVVIPLANLPFKPLTFHTLCDICTTPILPSVTRYHCPQCNGGDYDICMSCYHGLVSTGKISHANGPQGWRKCPQGHRMVVIGFQDSAGGQRRVVDRDVVGGWTFVDTDSSNHSGPAAPRKWRWTGDDGQEQAADPQYRTRAHSDIVRLPPDGGIGLVFYGKWNYFPDDATEKDLCFPKGAEIREAEDINGEWLWGYYAGKTGLFPAAYVDFLRRITM